MLDGDATFDEVKYSYRKLALELHPDKNKNEKKWRQIQECYRRLSLLKKSKIASIIQTKKNQIIMPVRIITKAIHNGKSILIGRIQRRIGVDSQKILKLTKNSGHSMKKHFGMITN